ncbi:MAG: MFS transporter [Oscillospiraceae bacterium]|jgi:Na+/melibiose symporter-like transporter|nr:MFS transporter [Oscillospiraceae bacterium]
MAYPAIAAAQALPPQKSKLNISRTLALSLPYAWLSVQISMMDGGLPVILTAAPEAGGLGLGFTAKGVVMALDNILGLFLLPLFGALSDKSRGKWGKRTPFILLGGVGAVAAWAAAGLALGLHAKWLFLILLSSGLAFMQLSRPANRAILPDFTPTEHRRTANALTEIVSIIFTALGLVLVMLFSPRGYNTIFYATVASMLPLMLLFLLLVRERKWEPEQQQEESAAGQGAPRRTRIIFLCSVFFFYISYNGLISSLSNYSVDVLGLDPARFVLPQGLTMLMACFAAVPAAKLQKKLPRKTMLLGGIGVMTAAFAVAGYQRGLTPAMFACFALVGAGFAAVIVNLYPFQLELTPPEKIGSSTGIFNTVMTLAMIVTPIASGALADWKGLKTLFPYCIAALIISFALLLLTPERKKAQS